MLEQFGRRIAKKLGLASRAELIAMHEMQMLAHASFYQLWADRSQRKASNAALVDLFFGLVRILEPSLFIEAGAKMADTSIRARRYLPAARIVAFEASPDNHALYSKTQPHKKYRVEYIHSALSDQDGTIDFNIRTAVAGNAVNVNSGANSILQRTEESTEYRKVTVPSKRIDTFFAGCGSCAFWIDVEGASKQVLSGAAETLKKALVAIVEVEDYEVWAGQWRAGKVIEAMMAAGMIPVARDFEFKGQYNIVFLNREAFLQNREVRQNLEYFYSELTRRHQVRSERTANLSRV